MAHAYTTKRGKNKLAKLGVRRDQQQNQERELKVPTAMPPKYTGPKERFGDLNNEVNETASRLRLEDFVSNSQVIEISPSDIVTCQFADCPHHNETNRKLFDCSSCHSIKYCCRECQLGDWSLHKATCKAIKKQLQDQQLAASLEKILTINDSNETKSDKAQID